MVKLLVQFPGDVQELVSHLGRLEPGIQLGQPVDRASYDTVPLGIERSPEFLPALRPQPPNVLLLRAPPAKKRLHHLVLAGPIGRGRGHELIQPRVSVGDVGSDQRQSLVSLAYHLRLKSRIRR